LTAPATDDIPDELIDGLPDMSGDSDLADCDILGALADVRRSLETSFQHEMDRLESSFGAILRQTEARLVQADLELASARAEHESMRQEHTRKSEALRELKRALEAL